MGIYGTVSNATHAYQVLTVSGVSADEQTVTIGPVTYEFDTDSTYTAGNVQVDVSGGVTAAKSITALVAAINAETTSVVVAVDGIGDTMFVYAKIPGTVGNSIATTEEMTNGAWGATTLANGVDATGTIEKNGLNVDGSYIYFATAGNGVSGNNIMRVPLAKNGRQRIVTSVSADYYPLETDDIVYCSSAGLNIYLLSGMFPTNGTKTIMDGSGGAAASNITIYPNTGKTINGTASITISENYGSVEIMEDSSGNFHTVGNWEGDGRYVRIIKSCIDSDTAVSVVDGVAMIPITFSGNLSDVTANVAKIGITGTTNPQVRRVRYEAGMGDATTQFDISDEGSNTARYTWDDTGTDPCIEDDPASLEVGDEINIQAQNFHTNNKGWFTITAVGDKYFEITNASLVAETNKTIGTGSIKPVKHRNMLSTAVTIGDEIYAADGVVDADYDDVKLGDTVYIDVDAIHSGTAPNGLGVELLFIRTD